MRLPYPKTRASRASRAARGFTLIELMISIALVLILVIGIQKVFTISADTVSGTQALSALTRDNRAAQAVMADDFRNAAKDSPHFVIVQRQITAIASKDEMMISAAARPRRIDRIGFFARGLYRRQTSNAGTVASGTSNEAFVWYGHLALPKQGVAGFFGPGEGPALSPMDTPDSFPARFANAWVLGRMAILLREPPLADNAILRNPQVPLSPISADSATTDSNPNFRLGLLSRYDLANAGIETIRTDTNNVYAADNTPTKSAWWNRLVLTSANTDYRFACNPKPIKPFDAAKLAQAAPYFIGNVSQFIVEFAGDFLTQDPEGVVSTPQPDGTIDYVVDKSASASDSTKWVRRIKWYGQPRASSPDVETFAQASRNTPGPFSESISAGTYVCAWHNGAPAMVRIMIKLEDPSGQLQEGQWCEYVFNVGQ